MRKTLNKLFLIVLLLTVIVRLDAEINAAIQSGADIGVKANNAIASLPGGCGTVVIPAGTYSFSTPIVKPRCVVIRGESGYGTTLKWTPASGAAVVIADSSGDINRYSPGALSDISLVGSGLASTSVGIFIGGDPTAVYAPKDAFGDFQNFDRVRVTNFGTGVSLGNNTWRDSFIETMITTNNIGVFLSSKSQNTGEAVGFTNSQVQNNSRYGIYIQGYGEFYFVSSSCDYNAECLFIENAASVSFIGSHIEQSTVPLIAMRAVPDPHLNLNLTSMQLAITSNKAEGSAINVEQKKGSKYANLIVLGGEVISVKPLANVVSWKATYPGNQQIYQGMRLDPTVGGLTSSCQLGCQIVDAAGTTNNGGATFSSIPSKGIRFTPGNGDSTDVVYGTDAQNSALTWSIDAGGNLVAKSLTTSGLQTGCTQYPCVVARANLNHLTGNIPATTLLSEPLSGLYRIAVEYDVVTPATSGVVTLNAISTSRNHPTTTALLKAIPLTMAARHGDTTQYLWIDAGSPLQYAVSTSRVAGKPVLDVSLNVERLQ